MEASMENSSVGTMRRRKSFRKLRWKNYLNHLLNLWLYCGNVSVDGQNYGENGSAAVNLCNKTEAALESSLFAIPTNNNTSFQPSSSPNSGKNIESHKSIQRTSEFFNSTRFGSRFEAHDDSATRYSDSNFISSNKSSISERLFHLIKSGPEKKRDFLSKSINHETSPDHSLKERTHKGPPRFIAPENIVNTTRFTNNPERSRVKKSEKIFSEVGNKLSIHYNQSSYLGSQSVKNSSSKNQTVRKKPKSVKKIQNNSTTTTLKRGMKKLPKVSLLGLFEMSTHLGTRWEGKSELAAAELAVKHINERGLLPGYSLELITNDTQVIKDRKEWETRWD